MSIALLLIDDGREDYLARCRASLAPVDDLFDERILVEDPEHLLGFAGAIQAGWDQILATDCELVFHVESDFVFPTPPPLERMAVLARCSRLAQVALKRQPWNERERAAGGIVEADADDFTERVIETGAWWDFYTEHRRFFTTNPSIYRREIAERGWPQEQHSEGLFTHRLLAEGFSFAFWGSKLDDPRVEHVGAVRTGTGY